MIRHNMIISLRMKWFLNQYVSQESLEKYTSF